ncbi:MAG: hypothetical protein ACYC9O_17055 [Candidatus Latescibacterota bacterium]
MKSLYKYLPSEAARSFVAGNIRIGTLHSFRKAEMLGAGVGDRMEGKRTDCSKDINTKSGDRMNAVERRAMRIPSGMILRNNYVEVTIDCKDCYILCFSQDLDPAIAVKMGEMGSEVYDSCIEIYDVAGLLIKISEEMAEFSQFIGLFPCTYGSRRRKHDEPEIHPALLKDPIYDYQLEMRAIWTPTAGSPKPISVNIEDCSSYCRLLPTGRNANSK